MDKTKPVAALFDLDGVIVNTEHQYSVFWHRQGEIYMPHIEHFEQKIKGKTLVQILEELGVTPEQDFHIRAALNEFESQMDYSYIPGVAAFIDELRDRGVKTAVVTSSNKLKMENVYREHSDFKSMFDHIFTAEDFKASKPDPDCYLLGARTFDTPVSNCFVFEDSFSGLEAGNRAGMTVVALSTTNPAEAIRDKAHVVMPDFTAFTYEKMMAVACQN